MSGFRKLQIAILAFLFLASPSLAQSNNLTKFETVVGLVVLTTADEQSESPGVGGIYDLPIIVAQRDGGGFSSDDDNSQ